MKPLVFSTLAMVILSLFCQFAFSSEPDTMALSSKKMKLPEFNVDLSHLFEAPKGEHALIHKKNRATLMYSGDTTWVVRIYEDGSQIAKFFQYFNPLEYPITASYVHAGVKLRPRLDTIFPLITFIEGDNGVCINSLGTYKTDSGMASYEWDTRDGGIIESGQGTYSVQIRWTDTSLQMVTVSCKDPWGCSSIAPMGFYVYVGPDPEPTLPIIGPDTVYVGDTNVLFTTPDIPSGTYFEWIVPEGIIFPIFKYPYNEISTYISEGAVSGDIKVRAYTLCKVGEFAPPHPITVLPRSQKPKKPEGNEKGDEKDEMQDTGCRMRDADSYFLPVQEDNFVHSVVFLGELKQSP